MATWVKIISVNVRKDKKKDPKENAQKKAPAKACRGGNGG